MKPYSKINYEKSSIFKFAELVGIMEKGTEKIEFVLSCKHLCSKKDFQENQDILNNPWILENKENFKKLLMLGGDLKSADYVLQKCIDYSNQTVLTIDEIIDLMPRLTTTFQHLTSKK